jgi:hypothetical protein
MRQYDFIYTHLKNTVLPGRIFMKLLNTQKH